MQKRILIIETEEDIRTLLKRMFEVKNPDYQVDTAPNVLTVLGRLLQQPFDLVLIDQYVADVDWLKLAQTVRTIWPESRILLMTGEDAHSFNGQEEAEALDGLIEKPFTLTELLNAVEQLVA